MANDLKYYMQLPYTVVLKPDDDGDYVARIDELEGCIAHGETPEAAFAMSNKVKELWITDALERGDAIPEPGVDEDLPSGRWVQRVPRALHKQLVDLAKKERTSLNTFCAIVLAGAASSVTRRSRTERRVPASRYPLASK